MIFCAFLFSPEMVSAQERDFGGWTYAQAGYKFNQKSKFTFKPILIHNNDFGNLVATFFDFTYSQKLSDKWSTSIMTRPILIDDGPNRMFTFIGIQYATPISEKTSFKQLLRYHHGYDLDGRMDADFLRYGISFTLNSLDKIKPTAGVEAFYRWNGFNEIQRVRWRLGADYKINKQFTFGLQLWNEDFINVSNSDVFIINSGLKYQIN